MGPSSLSKLTGTGITDFLRRVSTKSKLADWQFRQTADALQLLSVDLNPVAAGEQIDWDYWNKASKELGQHHPTLAKEQAPGQRIAVELTGPKFARSAEAFPVLEALSRTLRAKRYLIRTEQSYVDWCHRFLRFRGEKPIAEVSVADVQRFLSYLAVERNVAAITQSFAAKVAMPPRTIADVAVSNPLTGSCTPNARARIGRWFFALTR